MVLDIFLWWRSQFSIISQKILSLPKKGNWCYLSISTFSVKISISSIFTLNFLPIHLLRGKIDTFDTFAFVNRWVTSLVTLFTITLNKPSPHSHFEIRRTLQLKLISHIRIKPHIKPHRIFHFHITWYRFQGCNYCTFSAKIHQIKSVNNILDGKKISKKPLGILL